MATPEEQVPPEPVRDEELLQELERWEAINHGRGLTVQEVAERLHVTRAEAKVRLSDATCRADITFDGKRYSVALPDLRGRVLQAQRMIVAAERQPEEPTPEPAAAPEPLPGHDPIVYLRPDEIQVVGNVRKHFDEAALDELAASIRQLGILEPLLVRVDIPEASGDIPADLDQVRYELIAGERRLRAAKRAELERVPCIVKRIDRATAARVQLLENLQRQDLDPIEEAQAYQALIDEHGARQADLARELGVSDSHISNRRRLLRLPETIQRTVSAQKLTVQAALTLVPLADSPKDAEKLAKLMLDRGVSSNEAGRFVQQNAGWELGWQRLDGDNCWADHGSCPCRTQIGDAHYCRDKVAFEKREKEARAALKAKAKEHIGALRADPKAKPDPRILRLAAEEGMAHSWPFQCTDKCPCYRSVRQNGREATYCIDPARFKKNRPEDAYGREKAETAKRQREDLAAVTELVEKLDPLNLDVLRWVIAQCVGRVGWGWVDAHHVAKDLFVRVGKPVAKGDQAGGQIQHRQAAIMEALEGRSRTQLLRDLVWVWARSHSPENSERQFLARAAGLGVADDEGAPAGAPGAEECACDLCDAERDAGLSVVWENVSDAAAPIGQRITVCPGACELGDFELDGAHAGEALEALGWQATEEEVEGELASIDEDVLERLRCRVRAHLIGVRYCRWCGCTDEEGCDEGCEWVEADLCSSCVGLEVTTGAEA